MNPSIRRRLKFTKHEISNVDTGARMEVISSDVGSSWGALPDFVICDELCHWERPDLWYSLFSSAAKKPDCVLAVLTNAGVGRGWQWDVREAARRGDEWYFSSLDGSQAPWIAPDDLAEQQALLPPAVFARLWENRWQHSDGGFVTLDEAEACRDETLRPQTQATSGVHYTAAVDYAEKHDYTVGVVVHAEWTAAGERRIVVDRMDVVVPSPGDPTPVGWVEDWMRRMQAAFHSIAFVVDEYQLLGVIQRLESTLDVRRFEFASGRGNHALAMNLRKLIVHREVAWYPDCGRIGATVDDAAATTARAPAPRDDLETELSSLLLKQTAAGRVRIDHLKEPGRHDDRAFTLGAACLYALESMEADDWMQVTPPTVGGGFAL